MRFVLDALKFSQNFQELSGQGNGRCSWDVFMNMPRLSFVRLHVSLCIYVYCVWIDVAYHINHRRGFLRCSFDSTGQCEKPQSVERATSTDLHAFLYSYAITTYYYFVGMGDRQAQKIQFYETLFTCRFGSAVCYRTGTGLRTCDGYSNWG